MIVPGIQAFVLPSKTIQTCKALVCNETKKVSFYDELGSLLQNDSFILLTNNHTKIIKTENYIASLFAIFERDL